jgi:hypothetical protein
MGLDEMGVDDMGLDDMGLDDMGVDDMGLCDSPNIIPPTYLIGLRRKGLVSLALPERSAPRQNDVD